MKFKFFLIFLIFSLSSLSLVKELKIEELVSEADLIFYGRALEVYSKWEGKDIYTFVKAKKLELLKGDLKEDFFILKILGGTVGETTLWVEDMPYFNQGEELILFLKDKNLLGAFQGKISVFENFVHYRNGKYKLEKFLNSIREHLKDPKYPILSSSIEEKPKLIGVSSFSKGKSAISFSSATAKISLIYFINEADYDGDGYKQYTWLEWDADVSDKKSTLNVYEKIYWRVSGEENWSLLYVTDLHKITGNEPDQVHIAIEAGTRGVYDFRVEILREGNSYFDDFKDPSNEANLAGYKLEPSSEDTQGSGAIIFDIIPGMASAGTDSEVLIKGYGFESEKGNGKVEFFYQYGEPLIKASTSSWKNNEIIAKVPVGIINNYPASASSGPVKVTTNSGLESNELDFKVTFSYGRVKWEGTNPVVDYYVGENISHWTEAIGKAALTWSREANFTLNYAGTTNNTSLTNNGKNEVMFSKLDSRTIGLARYWSVGQKMIECDLVLNSDLNWSTEENTPSRYYDVETIVLHEMGHWLNLRDLYGSLDFEYDSEKVMYGYGSTGENKRNLHKDDRDGIRWIYGASIPPEPSFTWNPNVIYVGDKVEFYDNSSYAPEEWLWDFGDGEKSNQRDPEHTYYFSGVFPVKL